MSGKTWPDSSRPAAWYLLGSLLPPEVAHRCAIGALRAAGHIGSGALEPKQSAPVALMGLSFPNRIGLAAGFDKNGTAVDGLARLGFGFIEVGTVTPRPQPGQPRPRLFRLRRSRALINRMGFPNDGAAVVARRLSRRRYCGILGVNIGKNADTPIDRALDDYVSALHLLYGVADYIAINVSSPNTDGLRSLQDPTHLEPLLCGLLEARAPLNRRHGRHVPLLLKLSPDLDDSSIAATAALLGRLDIDGVIATNTTLGRPDGCDEPDATQSGGLSGEPLKPLALRVVGQLRAALGPDFPIIGVGGIHSPASASAMLDAGAQLIQLYTALVYQGPGMVRLLLNASSHTAGN